MRRCRCGAASFRDAEPVGALSRWRYRLGDPILSAEFNIPDGVRGDDAGTCCREDFKTGRVECRMAGAREPANWSIDADEISERWFNRCDYQIIRRMLSKREETVGQRDILQPAIGNRNQLQFRAAAIREPPSTARTRTIRRPTRRNFRVHLVRCLTRWRWNVRAWTHWAEDLLLPVKQLSIVNGMATTRNTPSSTWRHLCSTAATPMGLSMSSRRSHRQGSGRNRSVLCQRLRHD